MNAPLPRLRFSNDASCTGVNPCGLCARRIFENVLPKALHAAGFVTRENIQQVNVFFDAYSIEWVRHLQELTGQTPPKAPHNLPPTPPVAYQPPQAPPAYPPAGYQMPHPVPPPYAQGAPIYPGHVLPAPEPAPVSQLTPAQQMAAMMAQAVQQVAPPPPPPSPPVAVGETAPTLPAPPEAPPPPAPLEAPPPPAPPEKPLTVAEVAAMGEALEPTSEPKAQKKPRTDVARKARELRERMRAGSNVASKEE